MQLADADEQAGLAELRPLADTGNTTGAVASQVLAPAVSNDNNHCDAGAEETNCSDTMSTEANDDDDGPLSVPQHHLQQHQSMTCVRDRPPTPHRAATNGAAAGSSLPATSLPAPTPVTLDAAEPYNHSDTANGFESSTTIGSTSNLVGLAPPSYGTATRLCATLDASQLRQFQVQQQQLTIAPTQATDRVQFASSTCASLRGGTADVSRCQQQQQVFVVGGGSGSGGAGATVMPINHVISALGSMLEQQQQQQGERPAQAKDAVAANQDHLSEAAPTNRAAYYCGAQVTSHHAPATSSTAVLMDAARELVLSQAAAPGTAPLLLGPPQPHLNERRQSISGVGGQNVALSGAAEPNSTSITNVPQQQQQQPKQNQNQKQINGATVPVQHSGAPVQQTQVHQQQPPHRKRRRHRSAASAAASAPATSGRLVGSSVHNNNGQDETTANRSRTMDFGRHKGSHLQQQQQPQAQRAISAQCWLIDSSDEQTYAPLPAQRRSQQPQPVAVVGGAYLSGGPSCGPQLPPPQWNAMRRANSFMASSRHAHLRKDRRPDLEDEYIGDYGGNSYLRGGHLTVALARQSARASGSLTPKYRPLSSVDDNSNDGADHGRNSHATTIDNLKFNSLKMEHILNRSRQQQGNAAGVGWIDRGRPESNRADRDRDSAEPTTLTTDSSGASETASCAEAHTCRAGTGAAVDSGDRPDGSRQAGSSSAGSVLRLSALLSFVSNLVRGGNQSDRKVYSLRKVRHPEDHKWTGAAASSSSLGRMRADDTVNQFRGCHSIAGSMSVTMPAIGMFPAPGPPGKTGASNQCESCAAYGAGTCLCSTGATTSAATSAYVTGGASSTGVRADRNDAMSRAGSCYQIQMRTLGPMGPMQPVVAPTGSTTTGSSSIFYSSSGVSSSAHTNTNLAAHQLHSYEYCVGDELDAFGNQSMTAAGEHQASSSNRIVAAETQFGGCAGTGAALVATTRSSSTPSPQGSSMVSPPPPHAASSSRLAHAMLMSDNELIAPPPARGVLASAARSLGAEPVSAARRRWYWFSLKHWLARRSAAHFRSTDSSTSSSGESTLHRSQSGSAGGMACTVSSHSIGPSLGSSVGSSSAASYRSLRARTTKRRCVHRCGRSHHHQRRKSQRSVWRNVLSLAKADSVFRCRLIASMAVSCILLALICLLASLIYRRTYLNGSSGYNYYYSTMSTRNRLGGGSLSSNRLYALLDDSDQDLTWLWASGGQVRTSATSARSDSATKSTPPPPPAQSNDRVINSLLDSIERSEQLNQYQQTLIHLTNLQLQSDSYIDLIQLSASRLTKPTGGSADQKQRNFTARIVADNANQTVPNRLAGDPLGLIGSASRATSIGRMELDLATLTLLSNLYWPLVKWRYQSQRSMAANLLSSLAIMPPPTLSEGGSQTLRNLAALLMLTDSLSDPIGSDQTTATTQSNETQSQRQRSQATTNNWRDFNSVDKVLRETVQQIVSCSVIRLNTGAPAVDEHPRSRLAPKLRLRVCKTLLDRYRRLMSSLAQIDHQQLSELYERVDLPASIFVSSDTVHHSTPAPHPSAKSARSTLLGFLIDHLNTLDVRLIAESVLVHLNDREPEVYDENYLSLEESAAAGESTTAVSEALEAMLQTGNLIVQINGPAQQVAEEDRWQQTSYLYDFARSLLGNKPTTEAAFIASPLPSALYEDSAGSLYESSGDKSADSNGRQLSKDVLLGWNVNKLPLFARPTNYNLFLHPNLTTKLVLGMVKIEFEIQRPTKAIVINCGHLNLIEVNVWLKKQPPIAAPVHSRAQSPDADNGGQLNSSVTAPALKRIPVRRLLKNGPKLDQLYIEFFEPLEPLEEPRSVANQRMTTRDSADDVIQSDSYIEFGDSMTFGQQQQPQLRPNLYTKNQFVLNISFNKTNLMQRPNYAEPHETAKSGLKFVYYADYFAQPEAELKALMHTQFEPNLARQLFPCFDDPLFRSYFQLNLVHDQQNQVLFNAPKREKVPYNADGSIQMSVFERTPIPVSTHLLAFVVCDIQNIKSITSRLTKLSSLQSEAKYRKSPADSTGTAAKQYVQVQIMAQFEHLAQAEFGSQIVAQLLSYYQSHLQLEYPMEKLDLVAIPRSLQVVVPSKLLPVPDSSQQANTLTVQLAAQQLQEQEQSSDNVENFGLIWFRAPLLLVDTNLIAQDLIEQISLIISHQLAHQYFGNIVGIRRWRDLWLYEALCQYLEPLALYSAQPDWHLDEQFAVSSIQDELALDEYNSVLIEGLYLSDSNATDPQAEALTGAVVGHNQRQAAGAGLEGYNQDYLSVSQSRALSSTNINAAVLHMLLFNLLPSVESRARLLRRCLLSYRYSTMSEHQFWRQFGEQLTLESSMERLSLEIWPTASGAIATTVTAANEPAVPSDHQGTAEIAPDESKPYEMSFSERTVYVRPAPATRHPAPKPEEDPIIGTTTTGRSSYRLVDNLDALADAWASRQAYPLVSASIHRDRLELHQERFEPAWWASEWPLESGSPEVQINNLPDAQQQVSEEQVIVRKRRRLVPGDFDSSKPGQPQQLQVNTNNPIIAAPNVWPIPLMFVSRLNPKSARFFWFNTAHAELSLSSLVDPMHHRSPYAPLFNGSRSPLSQPAALPMSIQQQQHAYNWFKLNVNQSSMVRVNYDERNWEALTELLTKSHYSNHQLNPLDRANILDDALTLMRAGKLSVGLAMNLTLYLELGERDYQPWSSVLRHLDQMQSLLNQNPLWHRYVSKLLQPISVVIGWKDDGPHLMRKLRKQLFSVALHYADEKTLSKAKQDFKAWLKSGRFIVPNLQELVYVAGVRYGDQQEWFHCWQRYQQFVALDNNLAATFSPTPSPANQLNKPQQDHSYLGAGAMGGGSSNMLQVASAAASGNGRLSDLMQTPVSIVSTFGAGPTGAEASETNIENEKRQLLTALASTQNTWLLEQFLNYSIDSTKIQPHHLKHVVQTLGKNPVARLYLWRFVRLNWLTLLDRYDPQVDSGVESPDSPSTNNYLSSDSATVLETMIVESTRHFATKLDYDEVKAFFDTKRAHHHLSRGGNSSNYGGNEQQQQVIAGFGRSIERAIQRSLLMIRSNIYWRDHIEPDLTKWLSHYGSVMMK